MGPCEVTTGLPLTPLGSYGIMKNFLVLSDFVENGGMRSSEWDRGILKFKSQILIPEP